MRLFLSNRPPLWEAISFKSGMSSRLVIENVDRYGRVQDW